MTYLENNVYVYYHTRKDTNEIFYVGKGTKNRAYNSTQRSNYWKNIVNKATGFCVYFLAKNLTDKEALNFEKVIIQSLRKQNVDLCNLTDGGEGIFNPNISTREKMSLAKKGKSLLEEHKKNIAISLKGLVKKAGWKLTKEQIEKRVKSQTGLKRNKEACLNISEAKLAKKFKHSQETKDKISLTKKLKREQNDLS